MNISPITAMQEHMHEFGFHDPYRMLWVQDIMATNSDKDVRDFLA